jgi:hypothetical protein
MDMSRSMSLAFCDADSFLNISGSFKDSGVWSPVVNLCKKSTEGSKHWNHRKLSFTVHQNMNIVCILKEKMAMTKNELQRGGEVCCI